MILCQIPAKKVKYLFIEMNLMLGSGMVCVWIHHYFSSIMKVTLLHHFHLHVLITLYTIYLLLTTKYISSCQQIAQNVITWIEKE